jgi:hypothetical protein
VSLAVDVGARGLTAGGGRVVWAVMEVELIMERERSSMTILRRMWFMWAAQFIKSKRRVEQGSINTK